VIIGALFFGGFWISMVFLGIHQANGTSFVGTIAGLCYALITIALGLTAWIGVPLYLLFCVVTILFFLPSTLWALLRFSVHAPFLLWHHLHYMFVPHPAETAYKEGMAKHIPLGDLARNVASVMYNHDLKDYEGLPKSWKSKNWQRRLDALRERLHAEDKFMEELIRNLRLKDQLREQEKIQWLRKTSL
jgi:hypothetical protein